MEKISDVNVEININVAYINNAETNENIDPSIYKEDLVYILAMAEYMFDELDSVISQRIRAIDLAKSTIATPMLPRLESLSSRCQYIPVRSIRMPY